AITYFRYQGLPAERTYTHFDDKVRFEEVDELAERYLQSFINGSLDRVDVAYMKFLSAARQVPVVDTLLPLSGTTIETGTVRREAVPAEPVKKAAVEYEFLPGAQDILQEL